MTILDASLHLSLSQAVTVTAVSANTIDLLATRDIGAGYETAFIITCEQSAAAAGAATVNFQVITSAAAALTTPTIIGQTDAIPKASLVSGMRPLVIPLPRSFINQLGQRYLGLQYTVGTGPLTAGIFSCRLELDYIGDSVASQIYPLVTFAATTPAGQMVPANLNTPSGYSIK